MKLVIFDFDGTLVSLDIPWQQVKEEALQLAKSHDIPIDPGLPMMEVSNILSDYPDTKDPLHMAFVRYESRCVESKAYTGFPGMVKLIRDLDEKGCQLGVASANCVPTIERVLSDLGVREMFDVILGRESVKKNKPSPDQILAIMDKFKAPKEETIMIGDSIYDRLAAKAASVHFFDIKGHGEKIWRLRKILL